MFDLENYNPNVFTSVTGVLTAHRSTLLDLIGRKIKSVWVAWDCLNDAWYSDLPIVVNIEGQQLELCNSKLDQLAVSVNTIDLSRRICWSDSNSIQEWRKDALPEFIAVKGDRIRNIELIEYRLKTSAVHRSTEDVQIKEHSAWILNGIGFVLDDAYFAICNGLDKNQIIINRSAREDIPTVQILE
jgi:hypothetical protein